MGLAGRGEDPLLSPGAQATQKMSAFISNSLMKKSKWMAATSKMELSTSQLSSAQLKMPVLNLIPDPTCASLTWRPRWGGAWRISR